MDTNCAFHSFLMLYSFQMQQQQHQFEEKFEDLTLGEETKMDIQEEIPLGISTDPAHQLPHRQRTLLRQIEAEDAFIRDVCNYQEPDTITSESEADLAILAMEESFLTVSYLAGQCDSQAERAAAASAFKLAAAHVHEPIQSCQLQLHTINNKFHQLYKEFQQLTLTAMDVQQTQYSVGPRLRTIPE